MCATAMSAAFAAALNPGSQSKKALEPARSANQSPRRRPVPKLVAVAAEPAAEQTKLSAEITRTCLWKSGGALVKIPADAKYGEVVAEDGYARFVQFAHNVHGGLVNFFLRNDNPRLFCGGPVTVDVEVWEKVLPDGRRFLYVDLFPTVEGYGCDTHILKVVQGEVPERYRRNSNAVVFETPEPLKGAVVLVKK